MDKSKRAAVIAGNWKMNKTVSEAKELVAGIISKVGGADCTVIVCVPFTDLAVVVDAAKDTNVKVGAQNVHFKESGAYTGEISAAMLVETHPASAKITFAMRSWRKKLLPVPENPTPPALWTP